MTLTTLASYPVVALDLTNKSVLFPTQKFLRYNHTQKSTTSIHTKSLQQNMVGENCKMVKICGLENRRNTWMNVRCACMPIEIGTRPTYTDAH